MTISKESIWEPWVSYGIYNKKQWQQVQGIISVKQIFDAVGKEFQGRQNDQKLKSEIKEIGCSCIKTDEGGPRQLWSLPGGGGFSF